MNNETAKQSAGTFLVLVPHRDARQKLQKYSEALLKNGLAGVYIFPCVAPLARLSQPLSAGELKQTACLLRNTTGLTMITALGVSTAAFSENLTIHGPCLNLTISDDLLSVTKNKAAGIFPLILAGVFLTLKDTGKQLCISVPPLDKLEFRAAAIANMHWKKVKINGEIAYKWKIGKLSWLPKKVTKASKPL